MPVMGEESFNAAVQKVMREQGVDRPSAEKIVGSIESKNKRARLIKLRLAATQQDRRNKIQDYKKTEDYKRVQKKGERAQRRIKQEVEYINKGEPIMPTTADRKITDYNKKKYYAKSEEEAFRELGRSFKSKDDLKNLSNKIDEAILHYRKKVNTPKKGSTDAEFSNKEKLAEQKIAQEHGHSIVFRGHNKGMFRAASFAGQHGRYAKYWLLNAKQTNGNGWGIAAHTAKENMSKFIGRPLVVTSAKWHGASVYGNSFEHPYLPTNDLDKIFSHQEQYRVGNIIDVQEDRAGDWYATIEMLPKFANMSLPPFCSPAIYQLDASEHEGQISKWEALHLAALDENPAYGARIALLKGTCIGTANACTVQFKSAKQYSAATGTDVIDRGERYTKANDYIKKTKNSNNLIPIARKEEKNQLREYIDTGRKINPKRDGANIILSGTRKKLASQETQIVCPKKLKSRLAVIRDELPDESPLSPNFNNKYINKKKIYPKRVFRNDAGVPVQHLKDFVQPNEYSEELKKRLAKLKKKQKIAIVRSPDKFKVDREMKHTRVDSNGPLINKVPFGEEDRSTKQQYMDRVMRDSSYDVKDKKVRPPKPTQKDRIRIIKAKIASLGEENMTYQKSKKVVIRKKKYPEVRKAQQEFPHENVESALSQISDEAWPTKQSSFLSSTGRFIGAGEDHTETIQKIFPNYTYTHEDKLDDGPVTRFSVEHKLPRVQKRVTRAGDRISVGIHAPINQSQLKALQDVEKMGADLGFVVGDIKTGTHGEGFRDLVQALREHKYL